MSYDNIAKPAKKKTRKIKKKSSKNRDKNILGSKKIKLWLSISTLLKMHQKKSLKLDILIIIKKTIIQIIVLNLIKTSVGLGNLYTSNK